MPFMLIVHAAMFLLNNCNGDYMDHKDENIYYLALHRKSCQAYYRELNNLWVGLLDTLLWRHNERACRTLCLISMLRRIFLISLPLSLPSHPFSKLLPRKSFKTTHPTLPIFCLNFFQVPTTFELH